MNMFDLESWIRHKFTIYDNGEISTKFLGRSTHAVTRMELILAHNFHFLHVLQ